LRGHVVCADEGCDVEICEDKKYCAAHDWRIGTWLQRSIEQLKKVKDAHAA
jgi:hypothetical protein